MTVEIASETDRVEAAVDDALGLVTAGDPIIIAVEAATRDHDVEHRWRDVHERVQEACVYVLPEGEVYHDRRECRHLPEEDGDVDVIPEVEAERSGRRHCTQCFQHDVTALEEADS